MVHVNRMPYLFFFPAQNGGKKLRTGFSVLAARALRAYSSASR
jgi:hypothetical protein